MKAWPHRKKNGGKEKAEVTGATFALQGRHRAVMKSGKKIGRNENSRRRAAGFYATLVI
jgi:hypothetical protein